MLTENWTNSVTTEQQSDLARCIAEQREALAHMRRTPDDRAARLWLNDWCAEEVLIRLEARE